MSGDGDREWRFELAARTRVTGGVLSLALMMLALEDAGVVLLAVGFRLDSDWPLTELCVDFSRRLDVDRLIRMIGVLARLADSMSQCFQCAKWLMMACWCFRRGGRGDP